VVPVVGCPFQTEGRFDKFRLLLPLAVRFQISNVYALNPDLM